MGSSSSKPKVSEFCQYNKKDFQNRLIIINDAYEIAQFYGSFLLTPEDLPVQLPEYRNFGDSSEEYFNTRRKDVMPDLQAVNPKINNYYDFYKALSNLQNEYERPDIKPETRREKIKDVFNISYVILKSLIIELNESCDSQ